MIPRCGHNGSASPSAPIVTAIRESASDTNGDNVDIAAAKAIQPNIAEVSAGYVT
jgi:hypothetical protein